MDIRAHNRKAWDLAVDQKDRWTIPVDSAAVDRARQGTFEILLTPMIPVPRAWFGDLNRRRILCLASGGGQQGPILAAAGARVTVFDNSPKQLEQDRRVAERESLEVETVEGDMRDLSQFSPGSFDLIFHPCSNLFVPDVRPIWSEAHRVLAEDGRLLCGLTNPVRYLFDPELEKKGVLRVRHKIPYSDVTHLTEEEKKERIRKGDALQFGHTLDDLIGGQIAAGFEITGFYEDRFDDDVDDPISAYTASFIATRARKRGAEKHRRAR